MMTEFNEGVWKLVEGRKVEVEVEVEGLMIVRATVEKAKLEKALREFAKAIA
jgi:hypothetical protein